VNHKRAAKDEEGGVIRWLSEKVVFLSKFRRVLMQFDASGNWGREVVGERRNVKLSAMRTSPF
jgi:hypothetical protein